MTLELSVWKGRFLRVRVFPWWKCPVSVAFGRLRGARRSSDTREKIARCPADVARVVERSWRETIFQIAELKKTEWRRRFSAETNWQRRASWKECKRMAGEELWLDEWKRILQSREEKNMKKLPYDLRQHILPCQFGGGRSSWKSSMINEEV